MAMFWFAGVRRKFVREKHEKISPQAPPKPLTPLTTAGSRGGLIGIAKMRAPCLRNGAMKSLASKALDGSCRGIPMGDGIDGWVGVL